MLLVQGKIRYPIGLAHTVIFFLLFLAVFSQVQAGTDKPLICDYCKRLITDGKYIEANGRYYHVDHFLCDNCRTSLLNKKYIAVDGKKYCTKCYAKLILPKCAYCGKAIEGKYVEYDGQIYHKDCYLNHKALRCSLTGELINGEYLIDFWGNVYDKRHLGQRPTCEYCGRFTSIRLTHGGETYPDGRHICGLCMKTAVNNPNQAERLMEKARQILKNYGINIAHRVINLHLVNLDQLHDISPSQSSDERGLANYRMVETSTYRVSEFDIYILNGMPKIDFMAVAAHELMHIWQYLNAPLKNDPALCEGSCNYASYLLMKHYPGKDADFRIKSLLENSDPVYGDGFRRVKRMVDERGIGYWLELLKDNREFTAGY